MAVLGPRLPVGLAMLAAVSVTGTRESGRPPGPAPALYRDVSARRLPTGLTGPHMDAAVADIDGDGDPDVVLACEFCSNVLLLNDGEGRLTDVSANRLPRTSHDSEDVGIADIDGDGDLDIVMVSEDDQTNEIYLNDGNAFFTDASTRFPVGGITNALLVHDVDEDGDPDLLLGNNGQNRILINDGRGFFSDETGRRLPSISDATQDLELGDVDGDGDADLLVGNEDRNRLLINRGRGFFVDQTGRRLELRATPEETREADLGDIDGDGDLDILFSNVRSTVPTADNQNRILINDGRGIFRDETAARVPADAGRSFDADFIDLDADGDLDIIVAYIPSAAAPASFRVFVNDSLGTFVEGTAAVIGAGLAGNGFDVESADFDLDGRLDLYLVSRFGPDLMLRGRSTAGVIGCEDVARARFITRPPRVKARVTLRTRDHDDKHLAISINGTAHYLEVRGKSARATICCAPAPQVTRLIGPGGCDS